ncbi:hypothetical protein AB0D74_21335 [Streptomyces sp. NPDC048278]|uniref:hypothetical protein n=1 Tax=Streptomyces sp. NPDC048278 TaxID=3155809 RepID=UPI003430510A
MTLVSAVVGALIATFSTAMLDRGRWRREQDEHLVATRRALYSDYLTSLAQARIAFRSLVRNQDLVPAERERSARDSFAACYGARYQVAIAAAPDVVTASEDAFRSLRGIRDLAACGTRAGDEVYAGGRAEYEAALARLREAMRRDLGADRALVAPPLTARTRADRDRPVSELASERQSARSHPFPRTPGGCS